MATPQGNQDTRSTVSGLEDIKKKQGDYNSLLKDSINLLKQIDKQYDTLEGRLESMSKSTINIKDIEKELEKTKTKQYIIAKQLSGLEKQVSEEGKKRIDDYLTHSKEINDLEKEMMRQRKLGNQAQADLMEKIINQEIIKLDTAKESLNIEESSLIAMREANRLSQESIQYGEEKLKKEKEIRGTLGATGVLMGFLAEKLGIGASYQEDLVEKAKELQKIGEKLTFGDKLAALLKGIGGAFKQFFDPAVFFPALVVGFKMLEAGLSKVGQGFQKAGSFVKSFSEDSSNVVSGLADPIADLVSNIPLVGGLLSGMIKGFASFLDLIVGVEDKIVKMGRQLNLSVGEAMALNRQFSEMSLHSGDVFMNSKKLMESQVELSGQLGINNILSEQTLETNSKLKEFAGLEADTRAKIAESSIITGKSSESVVKSVIAQVSGLKNATGISFNYQKILGEASKMGGVLGLEFAKYPDKLAKSLVITKALGLDLEKLEHMAESFLDFESSISNEFEAQLLTGKEINLTKAREAFLNNDLATAATEITRQVGSAKDFLHMNRIAADSMAKAFGMSRDEMANMLKQQELLSKFGAKDTKDLQAKVVALKEQGKEKEAILMLGSQEEYQNMINASTQEKMMGIIEKIKQSLTDFLMNSGIVEKIQGFINYLSQPKNIKAIISSIQGFLADAIEFISKAAYYVLNALDVVSFGSIDNDLIDSVKSGGESMGASIRSFGGGMAGGSTEVSSAKVNSEEKAVKSAQRSGFAGSSESSKNNINVYNSIHPITGHANTEVIVSSGKDNNKYSPIGSGAIVTKGS